MDTVQIYGTEEIEKRVRDLEKAGVADFNVEYGGETHSIIARAWCEYVKIEFENTALEDELKDEYWDLDARVAAEGYLW